MTIEAGLLDAMTDLVGRRSLAQAELSDWYAGAADGGPNGDGLYPLTDSTGFVRMVPSPAKITAIGESVSAVTILASIAPFDHVAELTPSDAAIVGPFTGLYVGSAGSVTMLAPDGTQMVYHDCVAGQIVETRFVRLLASGTTASLCVGLSRVLDPVLVQVIKDLEVLPADVDLLDGIAGKLFVTLAGNVRIKAADGSIATFRNCPVRDLPVRARQVMAATTAQVRAIY